MNFPRLSLVLAVNLATAVFAVGGGSLLTAADPGWPQVLPPAAKSPVSPEQKAELEKELAEAVSAFQAVKKHARAADADIFLKAVRYAIDFDEWYDKTPEDGVKKARRLLTEALARIESIKKNETPWLSKPGRTVVGFYSSIDDSPQPCGVEIPEGLEWGSGKEQVPVWIWLHGRGDTATDLHFIASQMNGKAGEFKTRTAIIVHPFGRYCNGYKSAGETDVLECGIDALRRFNGDINRVALMGFSMGGAGAWHMGAHFADQWAVVHTGAGFVDVERYQKLTPDKLPPSYERKLWGTYDVPDYARNFFNVPTLISYSGEKDRQRDSAEYMSEVLAMQGFELKHLIGPGMEHKYHPEVREQITGMIEEAMVKGRDPLPQKVWLQSRSARYAKMHWLQVVEVSRPWEETILEGEVESDSGILKVRSANVRTFVIRPPWKGKDKADERRVSVDGQVMEFSDKSLFGDGPGGVYYLDRDEKGEWSLRANDPAPGVARKSGGTSIDDAFRRRFVVVLPDGPGRSPAVDAWVKAESEHFIQRWRKLMRGDPLVVKASEVGSDLAEGENLILWGDDVSNACIAQRLKHLPLKWEGDKLQVGGKSFDAASHVPVMIYPEMSKKAGPMVVINSGLTFREGHDRTNSLQNPKLPDWAVLNITVPPNGERAGEVKQVGFFDARWQSVAE